MNVIRNRESIKKALKKMKLDGVPKTATDEEMIGRTDSAFGSLEKDELVQLVTDLVSSIGSYEKFGLLISEVDDIMSEVAKEEGETL